ncbi:MAG: hypothetical protein OXP69_11140 [Spirochaetaceae bacterium]|nr:hypothetical protein [Spirochaetaceae bacterium]
MSRYQQPNGLLADWEVLEVHGGAAQKDDSITIVERIVHDDLASYYDKEFDVVARHVRAFLNDEEYVQIYIVFEGELEELRATNWAKGLTGRIRESSHRNTSKSFPFFRQFRSPNGR